MSSTSTCTRHRFSALAGLERARRSLHAFRPDLVHSHTYPANMSARLLRLTGSAPAVLSTMHNVYEGRWPRMLGYRFTDFLVVAHDCGERGCQPGATFD